MSLDDLPDRTGQKPAEPVVRRVDRAAPSVARITRAEELRVARPSIERLTGMFEAMAELEALCSGFAAERMSSAERYRLEAIHEELRLLSHAGNPERFHEVNERFHNAIYTGAHNDYIAEITLATRVRVQPFRRAQFRNLGRLAKSHAEHDRVVVAIMRGDHVGAAGAMRAHIELVRGEYEMYAVSV